MECGHVVVRLCLVVVVVGLQSGCGRVVVKLQSVKYLQDPRGGLIEFCIVLQILRDRGDRECSSGFRGFNVVDM